MTEDFWEKNRSLMFQATHGLFASGWTLDDLLNEARVGLWEASQIWRPEDCSWHIFAKTVARRRVLDLVTLSRRRKSEFMRYYSELEASGAYEIPEYTEVNDAKERLARMVKQVKLTKIEQDVLDLFLQDLGYTEIGEKLGVSYKCVDNAYQRVLRKLKNVKERVA